VSAANENHRFRAPEPRGALKGREKCTKCYRLSRNSIVPGPMALAISAGSERLSEATPLVRSKKHLHRFSDASLLASASISFNVK
jgi:hypothetical protein